jgi:hypothetical protein
LLGLDDIATKLQETLDEEREADQSLTELAESVINVEAEESDDDEEEPDEKNGRMKTKTKTKSK